MGRPLKFKTVEELEEKINAYFNACDSHVEEVTEWVNARDKEGTLRKDEYGLSYLIEVTHNVRTEAIPYTITGLALALDTSRLLLLEYEDRDDFAYTIKRAKDRCHHYAENKLMTGNPAGPIFNLKNNYGWKDKTETDVTSGDKPIVTLVEFIDVKPQTPSTD